MVLQTCRLVEINCCKWNLESFVNLKMQLRILLIPNFQGVGINFKIPGKVTF